MNNRLDRLREKMRENGIDVYYFNTSDYHCSEYVAEYFKTIRYFSGFTGSMASLLVSEYDAHIFVDGRYHIQADRECIPNDVEVVKLGSKGALSVKEYIEKYYSDKVIGLDGKRASISFVSGLNNKIVSKDIYSEIIEDRAELSKSMLFKLNDEYTGKTRKEKLNELKYIIGNRTHVINNLESIAYLLNLRGDDILHTPVFYSYMVIDKGDVYLFVDKERLSPEIFDELYADEVIIRDYDSYYEFLGKLKNHTVILDENKVNYESKLRLKKNEIVNTSSPVDLMKAIKNDTEIKNTRLAHIYDGVCMVRFIKWLKESDKTKLTEKDAADYLDNLRRSYKAFDLSFTSIVAYNENAASMHYAPSREKEVQLDNSGILLVDSGGQYYEGTTDITRTIALGPVSDILRKHFTIVLKSMLNLQSATFIKGMAASMLDILARKDIWALGIDYRCGTGHGVGHVLSVHENPPNIRYMATDTKTEQQPLRPGMIVSDEPGIYLEGEYGLRCENLLLVKEYISNSWGDFYCFEPITMCPFDLELIDTEYLDSKTIEILNNYHAQVYETLSPYLEEDEREFLRKQTESL